MLIFPLNFSFRNFNVFSWNYRFFQRPFFGPTRQFDFFGNFFLIYGKHFVEFSSSFIWKNPNRLPSLTTQILTIKNNSNNKQPNEFFHWTFFLQNSQISWKNIEIVNKKVQIWISEVCHVLFELVLISRLISG